jgi:chaperonin GroES
MSVKVGDKVIFKKYSPDEIKIDKEEYLVIDESDIIGIIEEK